MATRHPLLWRMRCLANLVRWFVVAAFAPLRRSDARVATSLVARIGIANNLGALRGRVPRTEAP